jgi:hypothetical protein
VPVVIIVASSLGNYQGLKTADLDERIAGYLARGGRVLWIGGTARPPAKSFGVVAQAMQKGDTPTLPVVSEVLVRCRVNLVGGNGNGCWQVAHSPHTPSGWQRPYCPWQFKAIPGAGLEPVLQLEGPATARVVGVLAQDRRLAYLPIYAVTPYLLEGSDRLAAAEPALDTAGRTLLFAVLERLK